jgi:hypothetical protein
MAGTWIIMKHDLQTSPEVRKITRLTKSGSVHTTIGRLHAVWSWADTHSTDGTIEAERADLDHFADCDGFADAMIAAGWLSVDGELLIFPKFGDHNGQTAKRRAKDSARKGAKRAMSAKCPQNVRTDADKMRNTEQNSTEQRRENAARSAPPAKPAEYPAEFESWWKSYPTRPGASRGSKTQAYGEWRKLKLDDRERLNRATANLAKSDTLPKDAQRFLRPERGDRGGDPVWVGWVDLEAFSGSTGAHSRGKSHAARSDSYNHVEDTSWLTGESA